MDEKRWCGGCRYFNGNGLECVWVDKALDENDSCKEFKPE